MARSWVVSVIENGVVRGIHTASCRTSILPVGTGIGNIIRHIIYANVYLARLWPRVAHQRCWAHKLRNLENKLKASQRSCLEEAKLIYQADNGKEALKSFRQWRQRWQARAPKAVACLAEDIEELLAFFDCPNKHWKRVRTTNVIERLFVEVRRRIRTMCAFTTRSSCERILYAVFNRMNDQWTLHPLKDFTQNN